MPGLKRPSLAQMVLQGDKDGFLAFKQQTEQMVKENPFPKHPLEPEDEHIQEAAIITYRIDDIEKREKEEKEWVLSVLGEYAPEAVKLPYEQALAKFDEVFDMILRDITFEPPVNKSHRSTEEHDCKETFSDCESVQKIRRNRFIQLSSIPGLVPAANVAIRSRLFTTSTGPRFKYLEFTEIASWHKNISIAYKGEELRQDDCSVWIQLCKLAAKDKNFIISCTMYQLLKALKLSDTGKNRKKVREQLNRLSDARIFIKFKDVEYKGTILPEYAIDGSGKILANLSTTISQFLGIYDFTMLKEDVRFALPITGQWFQAFLKSQAGPQVCMSWETIKILSGTKEENMDSFQRNFRKVSVKPLKEIGFIVSAKSKQGQLIIEIDKEKG